MSAGSGITPSEALKAAFLAMCDDDSLSYMVLEIQNDAFVTIDQGTKADSQAEEFKSIQERLTPKSAAYILLKDNGKFVCIRYIPNGCPVRSKMIYAASNAALKSGLGGAKFVGDFPISAADECTVAEFLQSRGTSRADVMSYDERLGQETGYEVGHLLGDTQVSVIAGIPIKVDDAVQTALKGLAEGSHSCVELSLDVKTETLHTAPPSNTTVSELSYPDKEPRYVLVNFEHTHNGETATKLLFIYYCPNNAPPKLKMLYSTCKANIIQLLQGFEIKDYHNLEASEANELTEELILPDLYPAEAVDTSFKKPVARGRGKAKGPSFKS